MKGMATVGRIRSTKPRHKQTNTFVKKNRRGKEMPFVTVFILFAVNREATVMPTAAETKTITLLTLPKK